MIKQRQISDDEEKISRIHVAIRCVFSAIQTMHMVQYFYSIP